MAVSAYVHIPFCTHKCEFCDFAAFAGMDHLETEYCDIVCKEIVARTSGERQEALNSIFYGGGTPGLIEVDNLTRIHETLAESVGIASGCEISLETTPHSITPEKAHGWLKLGINRLSIGVESLHDEELKAIGRDHSKAQALRGLEIACRAGFANISIDLMYGLPTQTVESWSRTLDELFELTRIYPQLNHFSAYSLHLATNSPLYSMHPKNSSAYLQEDSFVELFENLVSSAAQAGFEHYEVSNFAKPGFRSRHNLSYWNNSEYLAFGVSAHRYVGGVRSSNWRSLNVYMKDYLGDETSEFIDPHTRMKEAIMLGLRLREGINLDEFTREFDIDLLSKFNRQISKLTAGGMVEVADNHLRITEKGVLVSNSIISEFF
jgi:oxygen-independent coproporphyrinogen-3 oxidase